MSLNKYNKFWGCILALSLVANVYFLVGYFTSHNQNDTEDIASRKYIYYEPGLQTIHVDRKCKKLNYRGVKCERVELNDILSWREKNFKNTVISNFCPLCVSDEDYDFIFEAIQDQIFEKYGEDD